jgi:hypothetical protein
MHYVLLFGVMLIFAILSLCVLLRVDEHVETAEQELVEGKLCPCHVFSQSCSN